MKTSYGCLMGLLALIGCDDAMSSSLGASEHTSHSIVMRVDAATPVECPNGGSATRVGLDNNGDGALADDEVTGQSVVCDQVKAPPPAPPPHVVVQFLTGTAADGHCPAGGVVVQAGIDSNGSGRLEDGEITETDYLCDGHHDSDPPPTPQVLVRFLTNAAGDHCPAAGDIVQAGLDNNANGRLDDDEVTHTDYLCSHG